jgi:non-heme Fe2+,alpha-ketoglutarate-dependent halogenase
MLIAGEDKYGYWDRDVEPETDLDPKSLAFLDSVWGQYRDESTTRQVAGA